MSVGVFPFPRCGLSMEWTVVGLGSSLSVARRLRFVSSADQ